MSASPPCTGAAALCAEGLRLHRGQRLVLDGLDLELAPAERLAIAGASGCGKTTLLRVLAGLDAAESGQVWVGGALASKGGAILLPPWRRGLQLVFQDLGLWPARSVLQNVADVARWNRSPDPKADARELLARVGLSSLAERSPASLSGGEARRLAFARALAAKPRILLLDEPFASLDPAARDDGFALLEDALRETAAAVVLVSHDPAETDRLGGRRLRLEHGRLR